MKKISHYCATAAFAVGMLAAGVQAGHAASFVSAEGSNDITSSKMNSPAVTLELSSSEKVEGQIPQTENIKLAGRTGRYIALGVGAAILGSALTAHHYNRGYYNRGYYDRGYYNRGYYRSSYYSRPYRTYYRGGSYYAPRWAKRKCARRFKSFDWYSGTYVTYSGRVRLCPYLR